jgi:hypothetical protein
MIRDNTFGRKTEKIFLGIIEHLVHPFSVLGEVLMSQDDISPTLYALRANREFGLN